MIKSLTRAAVLLLALAALGCSDKKQNQVAPGGQEAAGCEQDTECDQGLACRDGECVKGARRPLRSNRITPDRVKREVNERVQRGTDRRDKAIEDLDQ